MPFDSNLSLFDLIQILKSFIIILSELNLMLFDILMILFESILNLFDLNFNVLM